MIGEWITGILFFFCTIVITAIIVGALYDKENKRLKNKLGDEERENRIAFIKSTCRFKVGYIVTSKLTSKKYSVVGHEIERSLFCGYLCKDSNYNTRLFLEEELKREYVP